MRIWRNFTWRVRIRWRIWRGQAEIKRANFWAKLAALAAAVLAVYLLWPIWERQTNEVGSTEKVETIETQTSRTGQRRKLTETSTVETKTLRDEGPIAVLVSESGVVVLARIALVGASAFIAGFVTQRILVANFAIEAGPFKIPSISGEKVDDSLTRTLGRVPKP